MADLVIILGTRPSYIKLWPVWRALVAEGIEPTVICTGQHQELITQHMGILDMPVHQWLEVMKDATGLNQTLGLVLQRVDAVLSALHPRLVIVQGDTTSDLGAALAAYHRGIPVVHVEAGLRSGNPQQPWPEETNRLAIDALSTFLFAPTSRAAEHARLTNPMARVEVTGNPVVDAVEAMKPQMKLLPAIAGRYVLLELHRRESFGAQMGAMVQAVLRAATSYDHFVMWPVHPNPAVQAISPMRTPRLMVTSPLAYHAFLNVAQFASLVMTDSGGVIEEMPSLGVPTLQLRDYTDRPEAIPQWSWLVGRDPAQIETMVGEALAIADQWKQHLVGKANPFGNGLAGPRIARHVKEQLS